MTTTRNTKPSKPLRFSPVREVLFYGVMLVFASFVSIPGLGQQVFFHLLGSNEPTIAFSTPATAVNESTGTRHVWPASLASWTKRRAILLDGVSTAISNAPVLVKLDATRIDYAQTRADGYDLRFADSAGNLLSHEVESWISGGTSWVWVKIPTLNSFPNRNQIYMYYGNNGAAQAEDSAGLWGADHLQILHLTGSLGTIANGAAVAASLGDSASAQNGGSGMSYSGGAFGSAITLDGVNDSISTGTSAALNFGANQPFSVSAFVKTTDVAGPLIVFRNAGSANHVLGIYIGHDGVVSDAGKAMVLVRDGTSSSGYARITGPTINDDQWHLISVQRNAGNEVELFVDGVSYGATSGAASGGAITTDLRRIGTDGFWVATGSMTADQRYLSGSVDEVRVAGKMLGAGYYQALSSMRSDGLAYFMPEEDFSDGLISLVAQLSVASLVNLDIPYNVSGTATAGSDHTAVSGTLNFLAGETSKQIRFRVLRDDVVEPNETVVLTLVDGDGYALGANNPHVVTISDETLSPPNAVDDNITLTSLNPVSLPVLLNDDDPGGDFLTITSFTNPTTGSLQKLADRFVFTPSADFSGSDSFTYTISDGRGGTDTATVTLNFQIPFTWTGAGADPSWTTGGNWIGGVAPGVSDTAYFNDQCSTSCDPVLPAALNIGGLRLNSSYSGTVDQAVSSIQIGGGGYVQRAGTFSGSNLDVTSDAGFEVLGGSFRSTSGVLKNKSKTFRVDSSVTFDANNGRVQLECTYGETCSIEPGTATYYDVWIAGRYSTFDLSGGSMKVVEILRMGDTYGDTYTSQQVNNGEFHAYGDYAVINNGVRGSATVKMLGRPTGQTVTGLTGKFLPRLTIEAGTQTVTLVGDVSVANRYTYVSGTVVTTGSTLWVHCDYGLTCPFVAGNEDYNNLRLSSYWGNYDLSGSVISVLGQLTIGDTYGAGYLNQQLSNGTFNVRGGISISPFGYRGTAIINSIGGNSTISTGATVGVPQGTFSVNKDTVANTLTFGSNVAFSGTGQAVNVTQGVVDLAGFNLTVGGLLTIGPQGKIICNGGTVTAGTSNVLGEISCGSSLGITWTGLAGDGLWSTAGNWTNNTIPGVNDIAIFSSVCGGNCDVNIDMNVSVRGIRMQSNYTGMITQSTGRSIAVSTAGWQQAAGSFNGGDATLSIQQNFQLSGGTFRAPAATWSVGRTVCGADRTVFEISGGTFLHNNSLLRIVESRVFAGSCSNTFTVNYVPGVVLYDLEIHSQASSGSWRTVAVPGPLVTEPLVVERNFYDYGAVNDLSVKVRGDVFLENANGLANDFMRVGAGKIILDGGGDQQIHSTGTTASQVIRTEKTAGRVLPGAGTSNIWLRGLEVIQGTFEAPTGTLRLGHKTTTSTTMNSLEVASTATFLTNGGTVHFSLERSGSNNTTTTVVVPPGFEFDNVRVTSVAPSSGWYSNFASANSLTVNGLFEFLGTRTTATWIAKGDVSIGGGAFGGTGQIRIAGDSDQTISGVATGFAPNFYIESTGGNVYLSGTIVLYHGFHYLSGVMNPGTSHVIFSATNQSNSHTLGSVVLGNVTFNGYTYNHTLTGTMDVTGTLTVAGTSSSPRVNLNGGTIFAHGDVAFSSQGASGTTVIQVAGGTNQTISGISTAHVPSLTIDSTGGTVLLSGSLNIARAYRHLQGIVDSGVSSVSFLGNTITATVEPLTTVFNNVGFYSTVSTYNIVGDLAANSTMTLASSSSTPAQSINGSLVPRGDLVLSSSGAAGNAAISFQGATNSTLNRANGAQLPTGGIVVNKSGGASVALMSDFMSTVAGQDLTVSAGVLNLGGFELRVPDQFAVATGAVLRCNGGVFSAAATDFQGTIECPGYSTYPFNWTGSSGDGKFSTAGNWQGGSVPGASDVIVFDNAYCGVNCDSQIDASASIRGVVMQSGYSGTFQQAPSQSLTVGSRGWVQNGGSFQGGDSTVLIQGATTIQGGTFTSTSGVLHTRRSVSRTATFNHNGGTWRFSLPFNNTQNIELGNLTLQNVEFLSESGYDSHTMNITGSVTVLGNVAFNRTSGTSSGNLNGGTFDIQGNISSSNANYAGTSSFRLVGSTNQSVNGSTVNSFIPNLTIASTGGTVSVTGTPTLYRSFVYSTGNVNFSGSTVTFLGAYTAAYPMSYAGLVFNHVAIVSSCNYDLVSFNVSGEVVIGGNLSLTASCAVSSINGGNVRVRGNVSSSGATAWNGDANLTIEGTTDATITRVDATANFARGDLVINKPGARVTQTSAIALSSSGQDFTVQAGTYDMAGFALSVAGTVTNNGTLQRGLSPACGALGFGAYNGTPAVCP